MSKVVLSVVVDTNFMTVPSQFNVDVFSEAERVLECRVEFVVLPSVREEIEARARDARRGSDKRAFKIAGELVSRCRIAEVEESLLELPVDDQLLEYTTSAEGVLATNDKELRARARALGIPVLFLRAQKRLALDGVLP
ncbi:MAG: PIN domain-containing protein [Candidatus Thorarchaeota archaeon]